MGAIGGKEVGPKLILIKLKKKKHKSIAYHTQTNRYKCMLAPK